ncbi:MAG: putative manganese transporter [Anaerovoracaceae bacterium]|jgi:hypothetical protein
MQLLLDTVKDVVIDTAKLVPFLFVTYLIMEFIERRTSDTSMTFLRRAGRAAPVISALTGLIPQCGFSAAASSLYAGGLITVGTLLAAFLATSDEMLPILLSSAAPPRCIALILLGKLLIAVAAGVLIDLLNARLRLRFSRPKRIHDLCEREHSEVEAGAVRAALIHTLHITFFIFLISLAIGFVINLLGQDTVSAFLAHRSVLGVLLSALIGLIPNCAASVMLTELFLHGILSSGQMMAGLLVGAGVGLLVLFRTNRNPQENIAITLCLYAVGVIGGLLIEFLGISFL